MRTFKSLAMLLMVLCALVTTDARAGYDKTEWGMSLAQVRKLYPGGQVEKEQDGATTYSVVRRVSGLTAWVGFFFEPGKGLTFVTIMFPEPDTRIDVKERTYAPMTSGSADQASQLLLKALTTKYGAPLAESHEKTESSSSWVSAAGDFIVLKQTPKDQRVDVRVNYAKMDGTVDSEGL